MISFGLFMSMAVGQYIEGVHHCEAANNDPLWFNINGACSNAGYCMPVADALTNNWGICQCCDPTSSTSWCYDVNEWIFGKYTGSVCENYNHELYGIIFYIFHVHEYNAPSGLTGYVDSLVCPTGSGTGVAWSSSDPASSMSQPSLLPIVRSLINQPEDDSDLLAEGYTNYPGLVVANKHTDYPEHCRVCGADGPNECAVWENSVKTTYGPEQNDEGEWGGHLMITFATDFNTYYHHDCAKPGNVMPLTEQQSLENPGCQDFDAVTHPGVIGNLEKGLFARVSWEGATKGGDNTGLHGTTLNTWIHEPGSTVVGSYEDDSGTSQFAYGLGMSDHVALERTALKQATASATISQPLRLPSRSPTPSPTRFPTVTPTPANDCFEGGYTDNISDLQFLGIAQSGDRGCRHGLEMSWPGGDTANMCDSPYVICLPAENTPNVGYPTLDGGMIPYLANDVAYTLLQCKTECAYDQRCEGFEFWADDAISGGDLQTGYCSLLDDIPVEMGTTANGAIVTESDLLGQADWRESALGGRICYSKVQSCKKYFGQDQLDQKMLDCYCPDNRKGFYTKKVDRTVAATVYCGGDADVTERIREAQANRMFHLCENWCLFNTQKPREESWYHDPWMKCWREQYAGVGTHKSYCNRVIRDPMTIEQYYIDTRSAKLCDSDSNGGASVNTPFPTPSPIEWPIYAGNKKWGLAAAEENCDDYCASQSMRCDGNTINTIVDATAAEAIFVDELGLDCSSTYTEGTEGWALPALGPEGQCLYRHSGTADTGCNWAVGVGYQRVCACFGEMLA